MNYTEIFKDTINDYKTITIEKNGGQRSVGDTIEGDIIDKYKDQENFMFATGAKSTDDFSLVIDGVQLMIDVKTHNTNSKMSMPNLISMKKLLTLLDDDKKELCYYIVDYDAKTVNKKKEINISHKAVFPIHHLNADVLGIGALGLGQLQIKDLKKTPTNGNNLYNVGQTKEEFKDEMVIKYDNFCTKQITKWQKIKKTLKL